MVAAITNWIVSFFIVVQFSRYYSVGLGKMELQKFLELGKELNLVDKELIDFATERQNNKKAESQRIREERHEQKEHENEMKELELKHYTREE